MSSTTARPAKVRRVEATAVSTTKFKVATDGTVVSERIALPPPGLYKGAKGPAGKPTTDCVVEEGGFNSISEAHVAAYAKHGYLLVRGALGPTRVCEALSAIDRICAEEDPEFEAACSEHLRRMANDFEQLAEAGTNGIDGPGIQFEAAGADLTKGTRQDFVRKLKNFHCCNKVSFCNILSHLPSTTPNRTRE